MVSPKVRRESSHDRKICAGASTQSLESKNHRVFVPYPLAKLMLDKEVEIEDSDDEDGEEEPERFNPRTPN